MKYKCNECLDVPCFVSSDNAFRAPLECPYQINNNHVWFLCDDEESQEQRISMPPGTRPVMVKLLDDEYSEYDDGDSEIVFGFFHHVALAHIVFELFNGELITEKVSRVVFLDRDPEWRKALGLED